MRFLQSKEKDQTIRLITSCHLHLVFIHPYPIHRLPWNNQYYQGIFFHFLLFWFQKYISRTIFYTFMPLMSRAQSGGSLGPVEFPLTKGGNLFFAGGPPNLFSQIPLLYPKNLLQSFRPFPRNLPFHRLKNFRHPGLKASSFLLAVWGSSFHRDGLKG